MFCPQCGAQLGEGAAGCAACGWSSSRKTLWIVLGSVFAFLCLACCGGLYFVGSKFKKAAEEVQDKATPAILAYHRLAVLNYGQKRGSLPETLAQAADEKLVLEDHAGGGGGDPSGDPGEPSGTNRKATINFNMQENGQDLDSWKNPLRYTPADDGSYEIRSSGRDGTFDNEDDLVLDGTIGDDFDEVTAEFQKQAELIGREFFKAMGLDPDRVKVHRMTPPGAPTEPPAPAEAPAPGGEDPAPAPAPEGGK